MIDRVRFRWRCRQQIPRPAPLAWQHFQACWRFANYLVVFVLMFGRLSWSQELPAEFEERFDQVVLTEEHGSAVVPVMPVNVSVRDEPDTSIPLRVRVLDYPDREYDVDWSDIARIEYFEDVVIAKAAKYSKNGKQEDAYRLLAYVWKHQPRWRGLDKATERFLLRDAAITFRAKRYEESLVVLDELLKHDQESDRAASGILSVADKMFLASLEAKDYRSARDLMRWVARRPYLDSDIQQGKWQDRIVALAGQRLKSARQALESKDYRAALDRVDDAIEISPGDPRAEKLAREVLDIYPRITVGVSRLGNQKLDYHYDWATRRANRLVGRSLVEMRDYGSNGGDYKFPLGQLTLDEDEQGVRLVPSAAFQDKSAAIASRISNIANLAHRTSDGSPDARPTLGRLVESIEVEPNHGVHVRLGRTALRWLPFLDLGFGDENVDPRLAAYSVVDQEVVVGKANNDVLSSVYLANSEYAWHVRQRPTEIFERRYLDSAALAGALRDGEVDLVDRLLPAEAAMLNRVPGIEVGSYAQPSCYFLVTNTSKPIMTHRSARRAIAYGIHRESILNNVLLGGQSYDGCQIITGPFPPGVSDRDDINYAYDSSIEPRKFDPMLASALMTMARSQVLAKQYEEKAKRKQEPETSVAASEDPAARQASPEASDESSLGLNEEQAQPLVLVCPQDAILSRSALSIVRSLTVAGIDCRLKPLPSGQTRPQDDNWDLWLIDVTFQDPIVDIHQLFGPSGLMMNPSTYVVQALDDLTRVSRWSDARPALRQLHYLVHTELMVIPLWQLTNHYAFSKRVSGISPRPMNLYQDVENWRVSR